MQNNKTRASVDIYGEKFTVKGGTSAEYMKKLAEYVDKKMQQIGAKSTRLSKSHVAILTAINIADELQKLQEDYDSLVKIIDQDKGKKDDKPIDNKNKNVKKIKQAELTEAHGF